MKKLMQILTALVLIFELGVSQVSANEGRVVLSGEGLSCEGVSLWKGSRYRVMGRCKGLVYPYATQLEHYVLWARTIKNDEIVRVGEVSRGYWDGSVSAKYTDLYLTAEDDGLPRRPSDIQVASGMVNKFDFAESDKSLTPINTPAPLVQTNQESITVQNTDSTVSNKVEVGSVVGRIVKSLLVIIGVIIVLVVGTSLIFRKRGSVSN